MIRYPVPATSRRTRGTSSPGNTTTQSPGLTVENPDPKCPASVQKNRRFSHAATVMDTYRSTTSELTYFDMVDPDSGRPSDHDSTSKARPYVSGAVAIEPLTMPRFMMGT